jgi:Uma2 family endonuclease
MGRAAAQTIGSGPLSYEDYLLLPDDGMRYEILDGELYMSPSPRILHQRVSRNLQHILQSHIMVSGCGELFDAPTDVILNKNNIAVPDLLFVRAGRESVVTDRAIEAPPDLIVEILSKSTAERDRKVKGRVYARFGVRYYWIADADARTLEMFRLSANRRFRRVARFSGAQIATSPLFSGLEIDLGAVWA